MHPLYSIAEESALIVNLFARNASSASGTSEPYGKEVPKCLISNNIEGCSL